MDCSNENRLLALARGSPDSSDGEDVTLLTAYRFDELVFITFEGESSNDFKLIAPTDINDTWKIDILRCTTEMNQAMLTNFVNRLAELNQMLIYLNSFNCKELLDEFSEVWF